MLHVAGDEHQDLRLAGDVHKVLRLAGGHLFPRFMALIIVLEGLAAGHCEGLAADHYEG